MNADAPAASNSVPTSTNIVWHRSTVSRERRWSADSLGGITVWFTGLSGSGKSTVADGVAQALAQSGRAAYLLDGDNIRHGLNGDLGFSPPDRTENIRRVSEVARLMADAGIAVLVPVISPYRADRERAREIHAGADLPFIEVFVDTPLEMCEQRDPKGLYAMARAGELQGMTGIDAPYEAPASPDVRLTPGDLADQIRHVIEAMSSKS